MPPKLVDDGRCRHPPARLCAQRHHTHAEASAFPLIPCTLCGSQENLQRKQVGALLREWERRFPGRIESIFNAMANVVPTHLMDRALHDFGRVRATGLPTPDGDIAFDADDSLPREAAEAVIALVDAR
jgi:tRNA 2-thiocytidine biosynthesis protein TtcA